MAEQITDALGRAAAHGVDPGGEQVVLVVPLVLAGDATGLVGAEGAFQKDFQEIERHTGDVLPYRPSQPAVVRRPSLACEVTDCRENGVRVGVRLRVTEAEEHRRPIGGVCFGVHPQGESGEAAGVRCRHAVQHVREP